MVQVNVEWCRYVQMPVYNAYVYMYVYMYACTWTGSPIVLMM